MTHAPPTHPHTTTVDGAATTTTTTTTTGSGVTVLDACRAAAAHVPTLCHDDRLAPGGHCRACLDRRARKDHAIDFAARECGGGHRDGEEGFPGSGRADPECDRVAPHGVDVALLVWRLWRHLATAVAPNDVAQNRGGPDLGFQRACH